MDKYYNILQRIYLIPALLLLLSGFIGTSVRAQTDTWSFEQHPHPIRSEWSETEKQLISDAHDSKTFIELCENVVNGHFQIYQDRYPNYLAHGDLEARFQNWKIHFITPESPGSTNCFYFLATLELLSYFEQPLPPDFYFCGLYSRSPISEREQEFIESFDAFMQLIVTNPFGGAAHILAFNNTAEFNNMAEFNNSTEFIHLKLNPDVVYFFSLLLEPYIETDERLLPIMELSPDISSERKRYVESAAQNLDLQSVLDTTQPCAQ